MASCTKRSISKGQSPLRFGLRRLHGRRWNGFSHSDRPPKALPSILSDTPKTTVIPTWGHPALVRRL